MLPIDNSQIICQDLINQANQKLFIRMSAQFEWSFIAIIFLSLIIYLTDYFIKKEPYATFVKTIAFGFICVLTLPYILVAIGGS